MIALKTILFCLALWTSISAVEDFVERVILHSKKDADTYRDTYTRGLISTLGFWSTFLAILFWTGLYLVNQLV